MGSMSRKFLNLIVNEHTPGFKSLRCIDLTCQKFFYDAPPPPPPDGDGPAASSAGRARDSAATSRPPAAPSETMGRIWLPSPSYTFRPGDSDARMHCFPLGDRKVICADQSGLALAFDAETRVVGTMCGLRKPKWMPISLPIFSCVGIWTKKGPYYCFSGLFVMERFPKPEARSSDGKSRQFEGFFNDYTVQRCAGSGHWSRRLLPQPPFIVRSKARKGGRPGPVEITAYTVVGRGRMHVGTRGGGKCYFERGSCICVSAEGAGTYCLDTDDHRAWTWTKVGEWMLPFHGKAEYVPELKLWFGFSAGSRRLAAADLSGMDSLSQDQEPPQLVGTWEELDDMPKDWREYREPQIVNLGSGRFCIARFFKTTSGSSSDDDGKTEEDFAVLTGVEIVPCLDDDSQAGDDSGSNGKVMKLRMIKHKSRRLHGGGTIDTMF